MIRTSFNFSSGRSLDPGCRFFSVFSLGTSAAFGVAFFRDFFFNGLSGNLKRSTSESGSSSILIFPRRAVVAFVGEGFPASDLESPQSVADSSSALTFWRRERD